MENFWAQFQAFITTGYGPALLRALVMVVLGLLFAKLLSRATFRFGHTYMQLQHAILLRRVVFYLVIGLALISAMRELGFSLTVVLGAAGILSVAIGFASQTSASNLISGLFLIGEEPFIIGDVIQVESLTGEVLSIDLLSVKIRTFDNLYVRVPNEKLIKSNITNLTRFPIRRLDVKIGVAYKESIKQVRDVLMAVAESDSLCLEEPKPRILFLGFGESSLDFQLSVWASRDRFFELRNSIPEAVKRAFDENGIEIPFPHRTLYPGSTAEPFPIRIINESS